MQRALQRVRHVLRRGHALAFDPERPGDGSIIDIPEIDADGTVVVKVAVGLGPNFVIWSAGVPEK